MPDSPGRSVGMKIDEPEFSPPQAVGDLPQYGRKFVDTEIRYQPWSPNTLVRFLYIITKSVSYYLYR